MITVGSKIVIIPSEELTELRLNSLLGEQGFVLEDLTDETRTVKGYMILIPEMYNDEYVWFIPQKSIYEQD